MRSLKNGSLWGRMIDLVTTMLLIVILSSLVGLILAFPVMWLWNFIFERMSNSLHIDVFQAWALTVLASILFGSSRGASNNEGRT
ncbi:MAG TPA: hypothetical protein VJH97_00020 [Candidatus Nanoarchaeia archaeon]|nr:hypothetical protein [Candidatus Nanoarchaeia archaeon]